VDATQELIAQGLSTIVGAFFNSFVPSGGLARSAVNAESGAQTQVVGIIVATLMLLAVQFLTDLFYYIPMCVLAAVIQVSVISMSDFTSMAAAWTTHRKDAIVMISTFSCTFFLGITEGLLVGVLISIVMIIHASAFPRIVHLGRLPESEGGCWYDLDLAAVTAIFELKEVLVKKRHVAVVIAMAKGTVRDRLTQAQSGEGAVARGTSFFNVFSLRDAVFSLRENTLRETSPSWEDVESDMRLVGGEGQGQ
ncbi:sulfate transporter family-domain-containing protein, partial [Ochromonadaceae sp. CCMP2298]